MPLKRVSGRTLRSLAICATSGGIGASIGFGYTLLIDGNASVGTSIGLVIGLSIAAFEVFAVASEVGDDKREIVYFGDTINTAARLQDLCKSYQRSFLVSGELLNRMRLPEYVATERLGEVTLRGKTHTVEVYAVSNKSGPESSTGDFGKV